jgi:hypothetical protein
MTPLEVFRTGRIDDLCASLGSETSESDMTGLYIEAEWTEELLTRVTSIRIDTEHAEALDVPLIIGVSSKLGFLDIIRILVYRNGFEPEGRYMGFDTKYTLSALETAIVYGRTDSIDLLVQCGTKNKWGEASHLTLFEFGYMSRQLESIKRILFWSERLSTGVCAGDSWVRVNFRMLMGLDREALRIFSESSDSDTLRRSTEKDIRLYILDFLQNYD